MNARLELTAAAPQIVDAVVCMDNSPAYAAFKEEIEAILADFNETNYLSHHWKVDPPDLTAKSEETMKNMHRCFLLWSFAEGRQENGDNTVHQLIKLFFKSECDALKALNGGSDFIDVSAISELIDSYKEKLNSSSEDFERVKAFFKGYVYGYFFNFLDEAKCMKDYAQILALMGVMSGAVEASVSQKQKALPKMAPLLGLDRLKYLDGYVPFDLMTEIVYDRIAFGGLENERIDMIKADIADFIRTNYPVDNEEGTELAADSVPVDILTKFFSYESTVDFSGELYRNSFSGVRSFLDCDRDDTGDYSAAKLNTLAGEAIEPIMSCYFDFERDPSLDTSLGGGYDGYRFPVFTKDNAGEYHFASFWKPDLYAELDKAVFIPADLPKSPFAFADEALASNAVRTAGGISDSAPTIRRDRQAVAEQIKRINSENSPANVKKMLLLEQYLCLISSNMSEAKYKALFTEHVMGTALYEEYIRYRYDIMLTQALSGLDSKKKLLDEINKIG